jgi:hypothetical protein
VFEPQIVKRWSTSFVKDVWTERTAGARVLRQVCGGAEGRQPSEAGEEHPEPGVRPSTGVSGPSSWCRKTLSLPWC